MFTSAVHCAYTLNWCLDWSPARSRNHLRLFTHRVLIVKRFLTLEFESVSSTHLCTLQVSVCVCGDWENSRDVAVYRTWSAYRMSVAGEFAKIPPPARSAEKQSCRMFRWPSTIERGRESRPIKSGNRPGVSIIRGASSALLSWPAYVFLRPCYISLFLHKLNPHGH